MPVPSGRIYSGPRDLTAMLDLLAVVRPGERITDFPSPVDLREALALRAVQDNTRLWFGARGQAIAFAYVDPYHNLWFELDRHEAGPEIESDIVAWGVECIRRTMPETGEALTLDTNCREDDGERIALLERHGFAAQQVRTLRMWRSLREPLPNSEVPAGFAIRPVAGEQEVQALVTLHRAAFGTEYMTVEERLSTMRVPGYEREMDLVVQAPDGRLAAYCTCWIDPEENERSGRHEGHTDPVATHPEFRRLGLARALLLTGLGALQQRGMDVAVLGTSSDNPAMRQAAEAVGFRVQSTTVWYSKPVSPG